MYKTQDRKDIYQDIEGKRIIPTLVVKGKYTCNGRWQYINPTNASYIHHTITAIY